MDEGEGDGEAARHEEVYDAILEHRVTPDMLEHIERCTAQCHFAYHLTSLLSPGAPSTLARDPTLDELGHEIESGQKLLLERYRIVRELGRGGQGRVFRAVDTMMGDRDVALKVCRSPLEARFAQEVQHRNVCRVFGTQRAGDLYLIEMELVDGPSLLDRMATLGADEARAIFRGVCAGVDAIHRAGVLHLDLNPRNVLLRGGVDPVVTDFGFAAPQGGRWRGAAPGYVAPEVEAGASPTPRADVYALGVLLDKMTRSHAAAAPRKVIARATAASPDERYADAAELLAAFEAPTRRRAAARRLVPLTGLIVLAAGGGVLWFGRCRHELGTEEVVDFSAIDDTTEGVDALPRLRAYRVSVPAEGLKPPSGAPVWLRSERSLYEGKSARATTSHMFITQVNRTSWQGPVSFTLRFDEPLGRVRFNRPVLYAETESGITHPAWSAHALDEEGVEIGECHEALIQGSAGCYQRACREVAAYPCVLTATGCSKGIKSVRFDSDYRGDDGRPFAAFQALLIERLTLVPWR